MSLDPLKGRVIKIEDWDSKKFKIYDSYDLTNNRGPAGSWTKTGLVLNDVDYFDGIWYATSYFTKAYANGSDPDEHKFIRFKSLDHLVTGEWEDLSSKLPKGLTPYYLTVHKSDLYLALFHHEQPGKGDSIFKLSHEKK